MILEKGSFGKNKKPNQNPNQNPNIEKRPPYIEPIQKRFPPLKPHRQPNKRK